MILPNQARRDSKTEPKLSTEYQKPKASHFKKLSWIGFSLIFRCSFDMYPLNLVSRTLKKNFYETQSQSTYCVFTLSCSHSAVLCCGLIILPIPSPQQDRVWLWAPPPTAPPSMIPTRSTAVKNIYRLISRQNIHCIHEALVPSFTPYIHFSIDLCIEKDVGYPCHSSGAPGLQGYSPHGSWGIEWYQGLN